MAPTTRTSRIDRETESSLSEDTLSERDDSGKRKASTAQSPSDKKRKMNDSAHLSEEEDHSEHSLQLRKEAKQASSKGKSAIDTEQDKGKGKEKDTQKDEESQAATNKENNIESLSFGNSLPDDFMVYEQGFEGRQAASPPTSCQVTTPALLESADPLLRSDYDSPEMPKLHKFRLLSWSEDPDMGDVALSNWKTEIPRLVQDHAVSAARFVQSGRFHSWSRASPDRLRAVPGKTSGEASRWSFNYGSEIAIFITTGYLHKNWLEEPRSNSKNDTKVRGVEVKLYSVEQNRACALFGNIMGKSLSAQTRAGVVSFLTKQNNAKSFSNTPAKGGMFKNVTTSAPSSSSGPSVLRADTDFDYKGVLEYSQSVPVFDGTSTEFDYVTGLQRPHVTWPMWSGSVTEGSCVVVAFTASVYKDKTDALVLNNNLQWLSILGSA